MVKPRKLAAQLRDVYVGELKRYMAPPVHPSVNTGQIQLMLQQAHNGDPILYEEPDETTWIWSDLHLGHDTSIGAFGRPFHNAQAADKAMHQAWNKHVGTDDVIICLGDVSLDACLRSHHVVRWSQSPGFKVLVLGNHDVPPLNCVSLLEIERKALMLAAPGDPPLLMTHIPLVEVPHGTINVHGHIHDKATPTANQHINVSVEQLGYAPVNLQDIRRLARRLVKERNIPAWETTGERLRTIRARRR